MVHSGKPGKSDESVKTVNNGEKMTAMQHYSGYTTYLHCRPVSVIKPEHV